MEPKVETFTFLFTDIQGSVRMWQRDEGAMPSVLVRHNDLLTQAVEAAGGEVFKLIGDAVCAVFRDPLAAVAAAVAAQRAVRAESWPEHMPVAVRMAIHTGAALARDGDYFGPTLNRVARILGTVHGGQTVVSQSSAELLEDRLAADVRLEPLGEHRLRDLMRPVGLHEVRYPELPDAFPPLKSLSPKLTNLPEQLTSFVGRSATLAQVQRMVREFRTTTLLGSGGVGKTRLSIAVGAELLEEFPDGVWFADLAPVAGGEQALRVIARLFGEKESTDRTLEEAIAEGLGDRNLLLILDNCEHVLDPIASALGGWLGACRNLRALATSREPLGVSGEAAFRVPSLQMPTAESQGADLFEFESVRLFVDRAELARPGFTLTPQNAPAVAAICRRLDGIPLALELAASRLRNMSVEDIARRLDDRFRLLVGGNRTALPRQQTLRAAIEWSTASLSDAEATLFRRLGVFQGGWTLELAEAACAGDGLDELDVLDHLTALVDRSLVVFDDISRYRYLETIRELAVEKLLEQPEERRTIRHRHARAMSELCRTALPDALTPKQAEWYLRFDEEWPNLQAAIQAVEEGLAEPNDAFTILGAIGRWLMLRGLAASMFPTMERLLQLPSTPTPDLARALVSAGMAGFAMGDVENCLRWLQKAHEAHLALEDPKRAAIVACNIGTAFYMTGRYDEAYERAIVALRELEKSAVADGIAMAAGILGSIQMRRGYLDEAEAYAAQALDTWTQLGNSDAIGVQSNNLGHVALAKGNVEKAAQHYLDSVSVRQELKDRQGSVWCLEGGARLAAKVGRMHEAARFLGVAEAQRARNGYRRHAPDQADCTVLVGQLEAALGNDWRPKDEETLEAALEALRQLLVEVASVGASASR